MNILKHITYISLCASLLAATPVNKKEANLANLAYVVEQGQKGSGLLLKTLGKNMKKKMEKGGVMKALDFCSNEAYTLTEKVNKQLPNGVRVQRISAKYRSPANKPSEKELAILKTFQTMKDLNIIEPKYVVEQIDKHTYKYYKPLIINKRVCLKCHGVIKDIDLRREIAGKYPLDNALGYKMGDLRGAVVVTVKK